MVGLEADEGEGRAVDESVAAGVEVLPRDSVAADVAVEH